MNAVGLRVDVVAIEHDFCVVEHLAQAPDERLGALRQRLVRAQRVEVHAVRLERGVVVNVAGTARA